MCLCLFYSRVHLGEIRPFVRRYNEGPLTKKISKFDPGIWALRGGALRFFTSAAHLVIRAFL